MLLFEMCCGWSPFYAEDTQQMYKLMCVFAFKPCSKRTLTLSRAAASARSNSHEGSLARTASSLSRACVGFRDLILHAARG